MLVLGLLALAFNVLLGAAMKIVKAPIKSVAINEASVRVWDMFVIVKI